MKPQENQSATEPDQKPFPRHIAIIMDGNGRWAQNRGLPRLEGHRRGVEIVRQVLKDAEALGLEFITLYSFSTENWQRPLAEVTGLMQLFRIFFNKYLKELKANNVRIRFVGRQDQLEDDILKLIDKAVRETKDNTGLNATFAFNYGARAEMADAAASILADVKSGKIPVDDITQDLFASRLYTHDIPDPDVVVRTSGEQRVSNYLLWQSAQAEFMIINTLWPDFGIDDLKKIIEDYRS
jgi:undecaprenyl diphosphate synthase